MGGLGLAGQPGPNAGASGPSRGQVGRAEPSGPRPRGTELCAPREAEAADAAVLHSPISIEVHGNFMLGAMRYVDPEKTSDFVARRLCSVRSAPDAAPPRRRDAQCQSAVASAAASGWAGLGQARQAGPRLVVAGR